MVVFVYDGGLSHGVAFSSYFTMGISGESSLRPRTESDFVSVATDGESYGHHHRYGEMALPVRSRFGKDAPTSK